MSELEEKGTPCFCKLLRLIDLLMVHPLIATFGLVSYLLNYIAHQNLKKPYPYFKKFF